MISSSLGHSIFVRNIGIFLPDKAVSHSARLQSSFVVVSWRLDQVLSVGLCYTYLYIKRLVWRDCRCQVGALEQDFAGIYWYLLVTYFEKSFKL
jgi:hypothetical protein